MVAALEAQGIPATVFGQAAATLQWEAGYTDPYKVMVRREDEATAREIIANPINDYVADFVAHMNPLAVLTARDVMEPGESPTARKLDAETPVKDVMAMMSGGVTEMNVQENGRNLGLIRTAGLMAKLLNPRGG